MVRSATDFASTHLGWSSVGNRSKHNGHMELYPGLVGRATMHCALTEKSVIWATAHQFIWRHRIPSGNQPAISYENLFLMTYLLYLISYVLCLISY